MGNRAAPNENQEDSFDYFICLHPWGIVWEAVCGGDATGCIYSDTVPLYCNNWYLREE